MATTKNVVWQQYNGTDYDTLLPKPSNHASTHSTGGGDAITPASIGATTKSTISVTLNKSSWSNKTITVSVSGVTSSNTVILAPNSASYVMYSECYVRCSAQGSGRLTFVCEETPTSNLTVNVLILN